MKYAWLYSDVPKIKGRTFGTAGGGREGVPNRWGDKGEKEAEEDVMMLVKQVITSCGTRAHTERTEGTYQVILA